MADCGSTLRITDRAAHAVAYCAMPAGHDGDHQAVRLRWPRLEQHYGTPLADRTDDPDRARVRPVD